MDKEIKEEMKVGFRVVLSDAVAYPLTVVVHAVDAPVAPPAMVVPGGFDLVAYFALFGGLKLIRLLFRPFFDDFLSHCVGLRLFIESQVNMQKHYVQHVAREMLVLVGFEQEGVEGEICRNQPGQHLHLEPIRIHSYLQKQSVSQ